MKKKLKIKKIHFCYFIIKIRHYAHHIVAKNLNVKLIPWTEPALQVQSADATVYTEQEK